MLLDLSRYDFRVETHGRDIKGIPVFQLGRVRFHDVNSPLDGVGHIHHIQESSGLEVAGVFLMLDSLIVYFHGVIGRSSPRKGFV